MLAAEQIPDAMKSLLLPFHVILVSACAGLAGSAQAQSFISEQWALLGREGGCLPIASLKRRLADLPDVRDPDAFERYLKTKGWPFTRKPHSVSPGKAVEFVVESQGLSLLFVTGALCASSPSPGR